MMKLDQLLKVAPGILLTLTSSLHAELVGHWAFDEGTGTTASDSSGLNQTGVITNATWGTDTQRASYLSFSGTNSHVNPSVILPQMTTTNDFSWAFWANSQAVISATQQNAIIIGNRKNGNNVDYAPRQFIKFTPTKFEWHQEGAGADNRDYADLIVGEWHHHAVVKSGATLQYYRDGIALGAPYTLTASLVNADPMAFFIGGEPVQGVNEQFTGFIDDVRIYDNALSPEDIQTIIAGTNLPPVFLETAFARPDATVATAYSATIAGTATDSNPADTLTYTVLSGPAWLTLAPTGELTGTPGLSDAGFSRFLIQVSDGTATTTATLVVPVIDPAAQPNPDGLFGSWPLNDGAGNIAADISGNHFHAFISNPATGGLGTDGNAWFEDPEFGTVLSFNGVDNTGASATVGLPPIYGKLPILNLEQNFTWSLWAKSDQVVNNDIILGNRYQANGSEFAPRQFAKFTSARFEFDTNAAGGFDYEDLVIGTWVHHIVVKNGADLTYYRDGVLNASSVLTQFQTEQLPLYFGGFGRENWQGYLSNIRLYTRALTAPQALALFQETSPGANETLEFSEFTLDAARNINLTWTSRTGRTYALDVSTAMTDEGQPGGWQNIDDSIPSGGDSTSVTLPAASFPNSGTESKLFFRVRKVEPGQ